MLRIFVCVAMHPVLLAFCVMAGSVVAWADTIALKCHIAGGQLDGTVTGTVWIDYDANAVTEKWRGYATDTAPAIITATTVTYMRSTQWGETRTVIDRTTGGMAKSCVQGCSPNGPSWQPLQCERTNEPIPSIKF